MKTILTLSIILLAGMQNLSAETKNTEACKTFISEGKAYKSTLKAGQEDATLAFYKENIISHCANLVAKVQYETNFVPKLMVKETASSIKGCKTSIKIAKKYEGNDKVIEAYKENIVDNCGTLVAKTKPAFCLFDEVDTSSIEKLKILCQSAIKEAHSIKSIVIDTKAMAIQKANIVDKCGKLQAIL
ncbi:hypothetical protein MNB_SV-13-1495 [hydrothermal vent metagenome]|uniref:Uncharacterized protein n=1 Tax=hydrothermal vent metagenome TaxID=652676 RepID=A0A1W1BUA5_9ZZZZ